MSSCIRGYPVFVSITRLRLGFTKIWIRLRTPATLRASDTISSFSASNSAGCEWVSSSINFLSSLSKRRRKNSWNTHLMIMHASLYTRCVFLSRPSAFRGVLLPLTAFLCPLCHFPCLREFFPNSLREVILFPPFKLLNWLLFLRLTN